MGKNSRMLKCFFKVMFNNEEEIKLVVPDMYALNVFEIDYKYLKKQGFENIIFDIDNTLIPVDDINVPKEIISLFDKLQNFGFNVCIMSNNGKDRVSPVVDVLKVPYLYEAEKPKAIAFDKALKQLDGYKDNTVMVGDQMMSDIKGAKEYGIYAIMTDPISKKQNFKTGTSRFLQNIMERHLARKKVFIPKQYYIKEGK